MKKFFLPFLFLIMIGNCFGQFISRTVIGSQGNSFLTESIYIEWTLGEVMSETLISPTYFVTQGFHQPGALFKVIVTEELEFFNGFSPNGDGHNDWWKIPMLNLYPINTVIIINRWGSEVWRTENYNNKEVVFEGKNMNGNELPDGTYFYIIQYNNSEKRGWVFIKR